jgi:hypothetical protein
MKFSPEGKLLMTLGTPGVPGNDATHFNRARPTFSSRRTATSSCADGHGGDTNARIVKFDKNGKFLKTWGKKGSGPGDFDAPHGLAMDKAGDSMSPTAPIAAFRFSIRKASSLTKWRQFGRPSGVFIDKNDIIYVADSTSSDKVNPATSRASGSAVSRTAR